MKGRTLTAAGSLALIAGLLTACPQSPSSGPTGETATVGTGSPSRKCGWIRGTTDERFALVEKHLRGFDMAMVETGYRYTELYWAGQDRNWGYAGYQLQKIETAISNGTQRRPARAASARMIEGPIGSVRAAIEAADVAAFERAFDGLTATCNACHQAEKVPFMTVRAPTTRLTPIRGADAPPGSEGR